MKTFWPVLAIVLTCAVAGLIGFKFPYIFGAAYGNVGYVEIKGTIYHSKRTVRWIRKLTDNRNVKAILVRIDSPGGVVAASQEIYDALKKARSKGKPVVVSMGSVAASGGYYIACAADKIVAEPGTVTGSIGVIMKFPILKELFKRLGIGFEVIKSGKYKDIGSMERRMTQEERKLLREVVLDVYDQFVEVVASSRGLPRDSVEKIADGRILTGRQAYKLGLVDTLGGEELALQIACELAGIKEKPVLVKPRKRFGLIDFLFGTYEDIAGPIRLEYRMEVPW